MNTLNELIQANKEQQEKHNKETVELKRQVKELKLKNIEDEKMSCLIIQDGLERKLNSGHPTTEHKRMKIAETNTQHLFSLECGDVDIKVVKRTTSED